MDGNAQSIVSLAITSGGAKRIILSCVCFARILLPCIASQNLRAPFASGFNSTRSKDLCRVPLSHAGLFAVFGDYKV